MNKIFEALETVTKKKMTTKERMELIANSIGKFPELEVYFKKTFGEDIFNIDEKSIEKSLEIHTNLKFRDVGAKVEWFISQRGGQRSLLSFTEDSKVTSSFKDFEDMLEKLLKVRGHEALNLLKDFFMNSDAIDAKWYARCLSRSLACGISLQTVNKILELAGKPLIEEFKLALCTSIDTDDDKIDDELKKLTYPIWGEPKFDGIRMIVRNHRKTRHVKTHTLSRDAKPVEGVYGIMSEFDRLVGNRNAEFDGELRIGDDFLKTLGQSHRKTGHDLTVKRVLHVFDLLVLDKQDLTYMPYEARRKYLAELVEGKSELIVMTKSKILNSPEEVKDLYKKSIKAGYEGIVLKMNKPYTRDRRFWFKMKPVKEMSLKVIGWEYGTGKNYESVSRLKVSDKSGKLESWVGTSKQKFIDKLTSEKENLIGKIVEVKFDLIFKVGEKWSFRFARFNKYEFRDDLSEPDTVK